MTVQKAIDWYQAGRRDAELGVVMGTHGDDEPLHEAAREERDRIRANIEDLTENQLRDYLYGVLYGSDMLFWHGI